MEWIRSDKILPPTDPESDQRNPESILVDCWTAGWGRLADCKLIKGVWHYWTEYGDRDYKPHFEPCMGSVTHWMRIPEGPKI